MGKNPCFLFYPSDWERDLGYHPLEIGGAWMLILCSLFWEGGSASKTLQEWSKIIRENQKKTEKILEYLSQKSICDLLNQNGIINITARRMVRDIKIREIRKLSGKKGGNPLLIPSKKEVDFLNQSANQNASKSQPPSVSVSVSVSKDKQKTKHIEVEIPSWINKTTWDAFIEMRKSIGAKPTQKAVELLIAKLEKLRNEGNDPKQVLEESITNNWKGIFPLKNGGNGSGNKGNSAYRTNIRGKQVPDESEMLNERYYAGKAAQKKTNDNTGGNAEPNDVPDFQMP